MNNIPSNENVHTSKCILYLNSCEIEVEVGNGCGSTEADPFPFQASCAHESANHVKPCSPERHHLAVSIVSQERGKRSGGFKRLLC